MVLSAIGILRSRDVHYAYNLTVTRRYAHKPSRFLQSLYSLKITDYVTFLGVH